MMAVTGRDSIRQCRVDILLMFPNSFCPHSDRSPPASFEDRRESYTHKGSTSEHLGCFLSCSKMSVEMYNQKVSVGMLLYLLEIAVTLIRTALLPYPSSRRQKRTEMQGGLCR